MPIMEPQITPNTFCSYTGSPDEADTTIFFISGNPGLIGYYHPFLSLLARYLADSAGQTGSYQIYGCSLGGFEISDDSQPRTLSVSRPSQQKAGAGETRLYDLEDQIRFVQQKLLDLMSISASTPPGASRKRNVILVGHSVGAYIAMELVRGHREAADRTTSPVFDIVGGVMLFPTVVDIALSPSGQKLTTLLSLTPQLALVLSSLARVLTSLLPARTLRSVIRSFMNDPPPHALDTTYTFLTSAGGVRQALHMAADEMRTITSDKWTDDVWGVATAREPLTEMVFYFGRNDHWVAEKTRDRILALRDGSGPRMLVCEEGLPHAFCLKHSDIMARKVAGMIREIGSR